MKKIMTPFGMMENHSTHPDALGEEPVCQKTIVEVREAREQIQEDIDCYISSQPYGDENDQLISDLQTIVVNNFKKLE
jgi:hypothetical protein